MRLSKITTSLTLASTLLLTACQEPVSPSIVKADTQPSYQLLPEAKSRLDIYERVALTADLSHLSDNEKRILSLLIDAAEIMDDLFWQQAFVMDKATFLSRIEDNQARAFAKINYGPWDRLNGDAPFLTGFSDKPKGANFYPATMTKAEFEQAQFKDKTSQYALVRYNNQNQLTSIAYNTYYRGALEKAAQLLQQAASLSQDKAFTHYLNLRADALLSNDYYPSDIAWMDMKSNRLDVVIGPIENYEDMLFGYRTGFEAYVLIKDMAWSERLAKFAAYLPELQQGLPVPEQYKAETPGTDADLNAYDVIYYAGHANAGSKTIAINLPNDERVQLEKGTRRLQLKNAMQAKFDKILVPISDVLIAPEQRKHITFDAFFANTMFHEVAHGLGIKNTINGQGTVRESLKEHASALEEGKADILGLYMVSQLLEKGVITDGTLEDYYTTFLAGIFRSVRFGASSAHGKANMIRFNFFKQAGAFTKGEDGFYRVNMAKMHDAITTLSHTILTLQGDGDYQGVDALVADMGIIKPDLQADLDKLTNANIPVDIVFDQGKRVLGLN